MSSFESTKITWKLRTYIYQTIPAHRIELPHSRCDVSRFVHRYNIFDLRTPNRLLFVTYIHTDSVVKHKITEKTGYQHTSIRHDVITVWYTRIPNLITFRDTVRHTTKRSDIDR